MNFLNFYQFMKSDRSPRRKGCNCQMKLCRPNLTSAQKRKSKRGKIMSELLNQRVSLGGGNFGISTNKILISTA